MDAVPLCLVQGLAAPAGVGCGGAAVVSAAVPAGMSAMLSFSVRVLATEKEVVSSRPFSSGIMLCKQIK
jgi:hypothetical protein